MDLQNIIKLLKSDNPDDILLGYEYIRAEYKDLKLKELNKVLYNHDVEIVAGSTLWAVRKPSLGSFNHVFQKEDTNFTLQ